MSKPKKKRVRVNTRPSKPCRECGGPKTGYESIVGRVRCAACDFNVSAEAIANKRWKNYRPTKKVDIGILKDYFCLESGGILRWLRKPSNNRDMEGSVGSLKKDGYKKVSFKGFKYQYHRIVFALHHERWPEGIVDHINGIKTDNRPENLREATPAENSRNQRRCGKSGVKGVTIKNGVFVAQICVTGRTRFLGNFDSLELAELAYLSAADRYFGDFSCSYARPDAP